MTSVAAQAFIAPSQARCTRPFADFRRNRLSRTAASPNQASITSHRSTYTPARRWLRGRPWRRVVEQGPLGFGTSAAQAGFSALIALPFKPSPEIVFSESKEFSVIWRRFVGNGRYSELLYFKVFASV
jgi:hypothetical protein